ncbi:MAG: hypothetical protein R2788_25140 [Saprospiraceae bacterium]
MKTHLHPSKLTQSLQLLTAEEFKLFNKWLQSPWANANKKLVELYVFLQKHYPGFDAKSLTKEDLFAKLYPGKKYDDKWMRNIMGGLSKQVENFLVHQRLEKDELLTKQLLAKEYLERHRNDWFEKQANQLINILEEKDVKETEDYLTLMLTHDELYRQTNVGSSKSSLQIADLYLDTFYSITKWRHLTELRERQMILPEEGLWFEKLERLSDLTKDLDIPIIDIYRDRIKKGDALQKEDYFQLKEKYFSHYNRLPNWDRKLLYFYFINMVIRFWMKGDLEIIHELHQLYKTGIENGLLFHYGKLTVNTYVNIVTTANSVDDFDYSKMFIEKYTCFLPPEKMDDGRAWALGNWHYKQGQYEKSVEFLSNHHFEDNTFIRSSKFLLIQSYFDACLVDDSYYLFFRDYCEAVKKYFRRSKVLSKERNLAYINFVNFSFKVIKLINENNYALNNFKYLVKEINTENNMQGKKWLLAKIEYIIDGLPQRQPVR